MIDKLWFYLTLIFKIRYCIQNYPYSKSWDIEINELAAKYQFKKIDKFTAKLGDTVIWINNHPYSSFLKFHNYTFTNYMPSRYTRYKLHKKLLEDTKSIEQKKTEFYKDLL